MITKLEADWLLLEYYERYFAYDKECENKLCRLRKFLVARLKG